MKYTLYHKNLSVITFELDENGYVTEIYKVENESHIPVQFLEERVKEVKKIFESIL